MNYDVFISYRRDGGDMFAHILYERLTAKGYSVFQDVESLRSGKFNAAIYERINECIDFILILPPSGLDRCVNEDDWVRKEVLYALEKDKNIVPVMLKGFSWPNPMPQGLEGLEFFNGIVPNAEFFEQSIERLMTNFLKAIPNKHIERRNISDFQKQQIMQCYKLIKEYLRSENVENADEYNKLHMELYDLKPFLPNVIFEQIMEFVLKEVEPLTSNYYEIFTEPMMKKGYGYINDNGAFEIKDEESVKMVIAHFYEVLFTLEEKLEKFAEEKLFPILNN